MNYSPGDNYVGLTSEDYNYITSIGNETVNAWLAENMESVAGGAFYITSDNMGLLEILIEVEADEYVNYFAYLDSMWVMI